MLTSNYFEINKSGQIKKTSKGLNKIKSIKTSWIIHSTNLGFYIVTPLLLGLGIGYYLDGILKTNPQCVLIGIIFGSLSSFYNLFRIVRNNAND